MKISKPWIAAIVIFLLTFLTYIGSISAPFIWDDEVMVVENTFIRNVENWPRIFQASAFGSTLDQGHFYRPIQILSFMLDYQLWGLDPAGFHLTSVIIHCLSTVLVFGLFRQFGLSLLISALAALVFGVHPINIESVTYISGRGDALFLLACLLTFHAFILSLNHHKLWAILVPVGYTVALLCKENAFGLPLILIGYFLVYKTPILASETQRAHVQESTVKSNAWKTAIVPTLTLLTTVGVMISYVVFRFVLLPSTGGGALSQISEASFGWRIATIPYMIATYVRLLIAPWPLHMEYHYVESSLFSPFIWIGLPVVGLLCWGLVKQVHWKWGLFLVSWFFIGLGPVYNIVPLAATLREHWAYLPMIGICPLVIIAVLRLPKNWGIGILLATLIVFAGLTVDRITDWQNPLELYVHDLYYEPKSFLLHNNAAVIYYRKNDLTQAKYHFQKAIETSPHKSYAVAYNNLGVILENEGSLNLAIQHFETAIKLNGYRLAYSNLGRILLKINQPQKAIPILQEGVAKNPNFVECNYFLALAYLMTNAPEKALPLLESLQRHYPNYKNVPQLIKDAKSTSAN